MKNKENIEKILLEAGFKKYFKPKQTDKIDLDRWDYFLEINPINILFYSFLHGHFTLSLRYDQAKGKAGGGYETYKSIMLPKLARTEDKVKEVINFFIN